MKKKTKKQLEAEQIERERKRIEQDRLALERERKKAEKAALAAERKREAAERAELRRRQRRPRTPMPCDGETLYVSTKHLDKIMKDRRIHVTSCQTRGGAGGVLTIEYETQGGGYGRLELLDLGPMPVS